MWPLTDLDVPALRAGGWRPTPIREVVLKVHQRCNLACDYCYVYTMADQSWRDRPRVIDRGTWLAAAERMAEHARAHDLPWMRLVLHGGEPLLMGAAGLGTLIGDFRAALGDVRLDVRMQTNGVLLDEAVLDVLRVHEVGIGVSLDGTAADNDRHRRLPGGRGSFRAVDRALRLLSGDPSFAGILCTVDPSTDPVACYETLVSYRPPMIDLLLPHANWVDPPGREAGPTPYANWLISIFDRWYDAPRQPTAIRLFDDLIALALGGAGSSEQAGLSPVAVLVVETDGAIEQADSLKSAFPGACDTGLSVMSDPFDAALEHPGVVARQIGLRALAATCRTCPVRAICGGGHYAHRFHPETGFRSPSVYCPDMLHLINHITGRVGADLRAHSIG